MNVTFLLKIKAPDDLVATILYKFTDTLKIQIIFEALNVSGGTAH